MFFFNISKIVRILDESKFFPTHFITSHLAWVLLKLMKKIYFVSYLSCWTARRIKTAYIFDWDVNVQQNDFPNNTFIKYLTVKAFDAEELLSSRIVKKTPNLVSLDLFSGLKACFY